MPHQSRRNFAIDRLHSVGITVKDNTIPSGVGFGYTSFEALGVRSMDAHQRFQDAKCKVLWSMTNNPHWISVSFGEGHMWVATLEREGDMIVIKERMN